jgi:hypothetical protein
MPPTAPWADLAEQILETKTNALHPFIKIFEQLVFCLVDAQKRYLNEQKYWTFAGKMFVKIQKI